MIVVRVELHSAVTGQVTQLAHAVIDNIGGDAVRGDYRFRSFRGRDALTLSKHVVQREGRVFGHLRQREHVWNLVAKALSSVGYGAAK